MVNCRRECGCGCGVSVGERGVTDGGEMMRAVKMTNKNENEDKKHVTKSHKK